MAIQDFYKSIRQIGEGSFAFVTKCTQISTGRLCAVKRIKKELRRHPPTLARFKTELEIMQKLAGVEGVIQILEAFPASPAFAYVMPLAEANLQGYIQEHNSTLDLPSRFAIIDRILFAVENAHKRSIIHRDLSPHNVLILNGEAYVADFGLGKDESSNEAFTRSSASGYGRSLYTAPEQLDKLRNASVRSDVYAIGKLMTFVMTGRKPDQLHDCSLVSVIRNATQARPEDRHQSVVELREDYQQIRDVYLSPDEGFISLVEANALFIAPDNMDWLKWHKLILDGVPKGSDHVYVSFIEPVVEVLLKFDAMRSYAAAVGTGIDDFASRFVDAMEQCLGTIGWPFDASTSFAKLLRLVTPFLAEDDSKRNCIGALWDLAYVSDRWGAQDVIKTMFRNREIPECATTEIVHRIVKSKVTPDLSDTPNVPRPITQALRSTRGRSETT